MEEVSDGMGHVPCILAFMVECLSTHSTMTYQHIVNVDVDLHDVVMIWPMWLIILVLMVTIVKYVTLVALQ